MWLILHTQDQSNNQSLYNTIFITVINEIEILSKDIDECASIPCKNGGTCVDSINSYNCKCEVGYVGHNCDTGIFFIVMFLTQKVP